VSDSKEPSEQIDVQSMPLAFSVGWAMASLLFVFDGLILDEPPGFIFFAGLAVFVAVRYGARKRLTRLARGSAIRLWVVSALVSVIALGATLALVVTKTGFDAFVIVFAFAVVRALMNLVDAKSALDRS
jgi:hypothetical protein